MTQKGDFYTTYREYVNETESPTLYHKWVAVSLIASALQRKAFLQWDSPTYPNFYIVLVGPSGCRKGTAMAPAYDIINECGIALSSDSITREALIQQMKENQKLDMGSGSQGMEHSSLTIFSKELTVFLGYQQHSLIMALTDWYDCQDPWRYTTKGQGDYKIVGTWVNLIGATTPTLLQSALTEDATSGGLTSRMIFVYANRKAKSIALPFMVQADKDSKKWLVRRLEDIYQLQGEFGWNDSFLEKWVPWYEDNDENPRFTDPRFNGYNERRAKHLLKLAMIFSASARDDMVITGTEFDRALSLLEETEVFMPQAFRGIGRNVLAPLTEDLIRLLASRKEVLWSEIMQRFYNDADNETLKQVVGTLYAMKRVKINSVKDERGVITDKLVVWIGGKDEQ
jgi:hypothetical protein